MSDYRFQDLSSQEQEWIEAYLNGTIESDAFETLQDRMMDSPALRAAMRRYLSLDYHLNNGGGDLELASTRLPDVEHLRKAVSNDRKPITTGWRPVLWAAAAATVLVAGVVFTLNQAKADIPSIAAINGSVHWTGADGTARDDLRIGEELDGGLLESLLPASWVELAFQDGSRLTVSGQATLLLSASDRKEIHLREGSLSANITSQPTSMPMLVHTQTAELGVVGTQFNVDAEPASTKLVVNEGLVRVRRLADGRSAEVPAGHQVTAAADGGRVLEVKPRGKPRKLWRSDLKKEATFGWWSSDLEALASELKKRVASGELTEDEAMAKYKSAANLAKKDGFLKPRSKVIKSGEGTEHIVVVSVSKGNDAPIAVTRDSRFRIRGSVRATTSVEFGFTTQRPNGGYAGKFATTRVLEASSDEFEIEVLVAEFEETHRMRGHTPFGKEIRDWWCSTKDGDAELEIRQVELLAP